MDALAFVQRKSTDLAPLYVLAGDEAFLKRHVLKRLKQIALGDEPDEAAVTAISGDKATFAAVFDELDALPFFAAKRVVIVETGDPFVTKYRGQLEKKIEANALPASGLLVLDVKTWPANTRLAKMIDNAQTIVCKSPAAARLPQWACEWAASQHQKKLPFAAGQMLVDLVGPEMGLLDQELLKLAIYVGERDAITAEDVDKLVGNNSAADTWRIFDFIGQGQVRPALRIVQKMLEQGEEPFRIVGALGSQLRKLAEAARLSTSHGMSLGAALAAAGVPPFGLKSAEAQLKHLTRKRAFKLLDWLLELQLDLRGNSSLPASTVLERFVLRLAVKP